MLQQSHRLQHLLHPFVLGQAGDAEDQSRLYRFLQAPKAIDIGPVLDDPEALWGHNLPEQLAIVLAYANHCPHSAQGLAGDGLEVNLFERARSLGMKETAMGTNYQRDAMQQTQQAQIIHEEVDGMDVHQVVAADCLERGRRHRVAARAPVAHAAHREPGFDRFRGRHGSGRKEQAKCGHLHRMPIVLQGNAQAFDNTLQAALGRKKLPGELQDSHDDGTSERNPGRRAIQSRKRRRRRRGSNQMARKIAKSRGVLLPWRKASSNSR